MAQLTYEENLTNAFPGMMADTSPRNDVLSRSSEESTSFSYGVAVVAGTDAERQVLLPTGAADLLGVALHSHANEVGSDGENLVDEGKLMNVLHVGRVFMKLEGTSGAVAAGAALFVRTASPSAVPADDEALGRIRADADTGNALAATGLRAITGGSGGDLIVVEIDPGAAIA